MTAATTGRGLLFIHGAGSRGLVWQQQLLAFPQATAPDLPGRDGKGPQALGPRAGPPGVDGYLEALRAQLPAAAPRVVAGHSLGGTIALQWALAHPAEVRALILIGTGARLRVLPELITAIRSDFNRGVETFVEWWFAPAVPPRLREKSLALLRSTPLDVLLADLDAVDRFDVRADLQRLRLPACIICGAEDRLTPVKYSEYLHERISGSDLTIVEGAGHMVMLEQPQATNAAIRKFLERLEGEGTP